MISLGKTEKLLGHSIDVTASQPPSEDEYDDSNDLRRSTRTSNHVVRQRRSSSAKLTLQVERDLLLGHSTTFVDLENLMVALTALEEWKDLEVQAIKSVMSVKRVLHII